jgi:hypothetical protein
MSKKPYYLSTSATADLKPAVTLGQGHPTHLKLKVGEEEKDVPVAYFWKDSIQTGNYVHPATKQTLSVDAKRIDGWVDKFHKMRAAGIEIPTPVDHSHRAEDNLGFVVDARRDGDRLCLLHQVIGEDAAMTALRNRSSLCIEPDYVDEKGNKWGDAFTHSAFTPVPVVSGMGSFVPFAASRDQQTETPIFYLSADSGVPEMDYKTLREALGVAADVPDDKLLDKVKELRTTHATALSRATEAENKAKELGDKVVTLSRAPSQPDPEILRDRNESKREKIEIAMSRGDLPKLVADKLLAALPVETPNVFMLSRADGLQATPIDFILSMFKDSQLGVATGSQTAVQTGVVLSREVPGANDDAAKLAKIGEEQGKAFADSLLAQQRR